MDTYLIDLVKYFAQFCSREAMIQYFTKTSEPIPGYQDLKTYFESLDEPLFPEVKSLIITTKADDLEKKINNISGYFMVIEYGSIPTGPPSSGSVRETSAHFSFILGHKFSSGNIDMWEELINMDRMWYMTDQIKSKITQDAKDLKSLAYGMDQTRMVTSPIDPLIMFNCFGWWTAMQKVQKGVIG